MEFQASSVSFKKREIDLKKILHFGSKVALNPCGDEFNDHFMFSDGFIIRNILLKNFAINQEDFSSCVFRIIPPYIYDIQKKMIKKVENSDEIQGNLNTNSQNFDNIQDTLNDLDHELKLNSDRFNKLKNTPIIFGQGMQLQHVKSQKYLAFHPDQTNYGLSENFSLQLEENSSEYSLFKILPCYKYQNELDKFIKFSDDIYIASALENINKDAYLALTTTVITDNIQQENALESVSKPHELDSESEDEITEETKINDDFIIAFEKKSKFRFKQYCHCPIDETNNLYFGDIVWISHFERETCLEYKSHKSIKKKEEDKDSVVETKPLPKIKKNILRFEPFDNKEMKNSIGMWKTESTIFSKGGEITWDSKIKFRNLSTGLYLAVKPLNMKSTENKKEDATNYELTLEKKATDDSFFMLKNRESHAQHEEGNYVKSDSFFGLYHHKTKFILGTMIDNTKVKSGKIEKIFWKPILKNDISQEDVFRLYKALPHEIWETRFLLSCLPIIRQGIRLFRIMNKEEEINKTFNLKFSRKTHLELLKECLASVMNFVHSDSEYQHPEFQMDLNFEKPNYKRQKILREQGFLDLLSRVVNSAFPNTYCLNKISSIGEKIGETTNRRQIILGHNSTLKSSKIVSSRKSLWVATKRTLLENENETIILFMQICRLSYELIKGICKYNYDNEIECFHYFGIFKKHVGFHLGATSCLISVLKSNEKLLMLIHNPENELENYSQLLRQKNKEGSPLFRSSFRHGGVEKTIIYYFLDRFEHNMKAGSKNQEFWLKLLDFLNVLCKYKNQGITVNQILINEALLQNETRFKNILITIEGRSEDTSINIMLKTHGKEIFYELMDFYENRKTLEGETLKDFNKILLYLQKQLELFSNLCFGRNYVNKKFIKNNLTMPVLMHYIWNIKLTPELRAVLTSVLMHVHIDNKPRTERNVPMYTKKLMLSDLKAKAKVKNPNSDIFDFFGKDPNNLSNSTNKHDAVVDISKLSSYTKTVQQSKKDISGIGGDQPFQRLEDEFNHEHLSMPSNEIEKEIIDEFVKEDESIKEEDLKNLKDKILYYLENEVVLKASISDHKSISSSKFIEKDSEVNFNHLLLNMIQLVRKLVLFECFAPDEKIKTNQTKKLLFFGKAKEQLNQNNFSHLVKSLVNILQSENSENMTKKEKDSKNVSANEKKELKIMEKEEKKQNLWKKDSTTNIKKKRKASFTNIESTGELYLSGINLKKKYLMLSEKTFFDEEEPLDVQVKIEICHILLYIMDLRHDYFLSLFMEFMQKTIEETEIVNRVFDESLIERMIKFQFEAFLPCIMENGIEQNYRQETKQSNFEDLDKMSNRPLLPLLIMLFQKSRDYQLNNLFLTLIFKSFNQRARIIKSLKKIQILVEEKDHTLYDQLNKKVLQLKFICEQSEVWLTTPAKMNSVKFNYKFVIYRVIDILKELVQILYGSMDFDFQNTSLTQNKLDDSDIDRLRQTMMRNLDVHTIILKLLKDGSYVLEEVSFKDETNKMIVQIFEYSYEFLIKFCKKDNKENKKILFQDIDLFIEHLNYFEVGQTSLICEIFRNNYKISIQVTEDLILAYLNKISNIIFNRGGHDPKYLDFFENIMFDKNEPIKENRQKITNYIFINSNKKYDFLFMKANPYYKKDIEDREFANVDKEKFDDFQNFGHHIFNLDLETCNSNDSPFIYQSRALKILYNCIKTSDDKQILKFIVQKILNLNYIFDLLTKKTIYFCNNPKAFLTTILNSQLLRLLNEVWFNSEKPPSSLFNNKYVLKFLENEIECLKRLTRSEIIKIKETKRSKTLDSLKSRSSFNQSPIRKKKKSSFDEIDSDEENEHAKLEEIISTYCKDYEFDYINSLFSDILPVIISLSKILVLNEQIIDDEFSGREDLKTLNRYAETFILFFKANIESDDILNRFGALKVLQDFEKAFNVNLDLPAEKENEEEKIENLEKEIEEEIELPLQNILMHRKNESRKPRDNFWRIFILNILTSDKIKELIIPEKNALISAIKQIDELIYPEDFKKKSQPGNLEQFIKKLVVFIKYGIENNQTVDYEIINQIILLFSDLIESCNGNKKEEMQNLMNRCNVTKTILFFICSQEIEQMTYTRMIDLCINLLEGGNSDVQKSFYEYFIESPNSENFFFKLNKLINDEISYLNKSKSLHEKVDLCLKDINYSFKTTSRFNITNVLRLLQLLTENHNEYLQNYFRYQFKSRNNYDILNLIVKLLETLLRELTDSNYPKILQCFDTLTEFIQGPCEANQVSLAEGKFILIACIILDKNDSLGESKRKGGLYRRNTKNENIEKNAKISIDALQNESEESNEIKFQNKIIRYLETISKNFAKTVGMTFSKHNPYKFESWMVSNLKFKCIITLESILEGQNDVMILKKIMKNLPIDLLKQNLAWIYEKYQKMYDTIYQNEAFNHSELDPKTVQNKDKLGLIIESGFKIFVILRRYLEVDPGETGDDETPIENWTLLKKEFETLLGEDNMLNRLGEFGIDLLKTGFSAVEKIGQITKITNIIASVTESNPKSQDKFERDDVKYNRFVKDGISFFGKHTAHIEVSRNNKLYRQYFPKLPHCMTLEKSVKTTFHNRVNRVSVNSKVTSLVNKANDLINILKHEEKLREFFNKQRIFALLGKHVSLWKDLSFIICIAQNFIILKITKKDHLFQFTSIFAKKKTQVADLGKYYDALLVLEILQIICCFLMLFFFLAKRAPIVYRKAKNRVEEIELSFAKGVKNKGKSSIKKKLYTALINAFIFFKYLTFDPLILYYILYTSCAIIGMFNPLFSALLLIDIFSRFPVLRHVGNSIWRPKYQIFLTVFLFIIFQYYFTYIAFYLLYDDYEGICNHLWSCLSMIFDNTFKTNGGIGGLFSYGESDEDKNYKLEIQTFYDFIYYFFIVILIMQIISGIIIDTFAILRAEEEKKKNDMENFCFICGIDRETLDKKGDNKKGYLYHVKIEHNMWNYIFFMSYLKNKEKTEYTGFESYISDKLENNDLTWFPLHNALSISDSHSKEKLNEFKNMKDETLKNKTTEIMEGVEKRIYNIHNLLFKTRKSSD